MAGRSEALGIERLANVHFYVRDIERSHRFYTEQLDFMWVGCSTPEQQATSHATTRVYEAGEARLSLTQPIEPQSRPGRFLARHPDGVATLDLVVGDVERTYTVLGERGATMTGAIERGKDERGEAVATFEITTPFGDVTFRFLETANPHALLPGVELFEVPRGGANRLGFGGFDHVTSNFLTLKPMELWCREVLGFERYWGIRFHTDDVAPENDHGSGLDSLVLWDPASGLKFANNEPLRPFFEDSQIYIYVEENRGPGVQHVALTTPDIIATVREMHRRGLKFMPTPETYYEMLPARIERTGIGAVDEDLGTLAELGILVDGKGPGSYLLQIFVEELASIHDDPQAGPFFFEVIERKGDKGFGGGNFRALFESIERAQKDQGKRD